MPGPVDQRVGVLTATTTRAIPAAMMASVHGGVRPWWAHGSSVTYRVPPAARGPAAASAATSAWAPPGGAVAPVNHCRLAARPRHHTTAPTHGFGAVRPRTGSAASTARAIHSRRPAAGRDPRDAVRTAAPCTASDRGSQDVRPPPRADAGGRRRPSRPRRRWPPSGPRRPPCARRCPRRPRCRWSARPRAAARRTCRTLGMTSAMKDWPPKPGNTVMHRIRSTWSR